MGLAAVLCLPSRWPCKRVRVASEPGSSITRPPGPRQLVGLGQLVLPKLLFIPPSGARLVHLGRRRIMPKAYAVGWAQEVGGGILKLGSPSRHLLCSQKVSRRGSNLTRRDLAGEGHLRAGGGAHLCTLTPRGPLTGGLPLHLNHTLGVPAGLPGVEGPHSDSHFDGRSSHLAQLAAQSPGEETKETRAGFSTVFTAGVGRSLVCCCSHTHRGGSQRAWRKEHPSIRQDAPTTSAYKCPVELPPPPGDRTLPAALLPRGPGRKRPATLQAKAKAPSSTARPLCTGAPCHLGKQSWEDTNPELPRPPALLRLKGPAEVGVTWQAEGGPRFWAAPCSPTDSLLAPVSWAP